MSLRALTRSSQSVAIFIMIVIARNAVTWQSCIFMWSKVYYVYILTNFTKTVKYIGVTNNLSRRFYEHKNGLIEGFTKKYQIKYLIHFESYTDIKEAIEREKQIKSWSRKRKEQLINKTNPNWEDLGNIIQIK